jgi:hypothetical protein
MRSRWPRFRFTLRTLLIVITIPVPFLAWVASIKIAAVQQRAAIAELQSGNHFVARDTPPTDFLSKLFHRFVDKDAFQTVHRVQLCNFTIRYGNPPPMPVERDDLDALSRINGLRDVEIFQDPRWPLQGVHDSSQRLSDSDLRFLGHMKTLECIQTDVELSEQTLLKLAKLPKVSSLTLPNSAISDNVLEQLGENPQIKYLEFDASQVSSKGLKHLESLPALQTLCLWRLKDDDALIPIIAHYQALFELVINDSELTVADAVALNRLPIQRLTTNNCRMEADVVKALNDATSRPQTFLQKSK